MGPNKMRQVSSDQWAGSGALRKKAQLYKILIFSYCQSLMAGTGSLHASDRNASTPPSADYSVALKFVERNIVSFGTV